jgi:sRNA-binding carbon storage regulator CsrA
LTLGRKVGDTVVIRAPQKAMITVHITEIGSGRVRLSFAATPDVIIDRGEVDEAKQAAAEAAGRQEV